MTLRIATLLAGTPAGGGAELFFERFSAALLRAGAATLPLIRRDAPRAARLRAAGLAPVQLGFGGWPDLLTRPRAARALRQFEAQAAIAFMGRAAHHAPFGPWTLIGRLGGRYDLRRFARCDHLVANTRALADWLLAEGTPPDRAHHLPNFAPDLAGAPPAALPVPAGANVALALGRLHAAKGFDVLIHAAPRLPGLHVVLAGDGELRAPLAALAQRLGVADRVHFLGWRHDIAALLAAADLLVVPSRLEPLGNVVLEAFSAARPVVATTTEGPSALIAPGRNGVLVPAGSATALAAGIEGVLADRAQAARLAAAGREDWERAHGEAAVMPLWLDFLHVVIRQRAGARPA